MRGGVRGGVVMGGRGSDIEKKKKTIKKESNNFQINIFSFSFRHENIPYVFGQIGLGKQCRPRWNAADCRSHQSLHCLLLIRLVVISILGTSSYEIYVIFIEKMAKLFANSGDPDQMPQDVACDLGLHCLPITLFRVSRLQWANWWPQCMFSWRNKKKMSSYFGW